MDFEVPQLLSTISTHGVKGCESATLLIGVEDWAKFDFGDVNGGEKFEEVLEVFFLLSELLEFILSLFIRGFKAELVADIEAELIGLEFETVADGVPWLAAILNFRATRSDVISEFLSGKAGLKRVCERT